MKLQRNIPTKDNELQDLCTIYCDAAKSSKIFESSAGKALVDALDNARNRFKVGCEDARFRDTLKVAARKELKKELVAVLKRVIHYMEAMATDEDLKELQKAGVRLAKPKTRKKKAKADVELAPAQA